MVFQKLEKIKISALLVFFQIWKNFDLFGTFWDLKILSVFAIFILNKMGTKIFNILIFSGQKSAFFAILETSKKSKNYLQGLEPCFLKSNPKSDSLKHNFKNVKNDEFYKNCDATWVLNFTNSKCEILSKNWKKLEVCQERTYLKNLKFRRKIMIFRKISSKFWKHGSQPCQKIL